jgi:hydroxyacylglutathione hydrolase
MTDQGFFVEQFVDTGLGNSSYLVGSYDTKLAVLIDPLRDVDHYIAAAERNSVQLVSVLDTHVHADFVSGAREIANHTGAVIGASKEAGLGFDHQPLVEGDELPLGSFTLKVMETPGHTPEHISFLITAEDGRTPSALFSGGALIVGGAARTDLLGHDLSIPLARRLYHTLQHKLMPLPDEVSVYPTHGAGSFCVAPASADRVTTIGRERQTNALAQPQSEEDFVQRALSGLPSYPYYYRYMRGINQRGPSLLGGLPILPPLAAQEVNELMAKGALILDVRRKRPFTEAHIPGAFGIMVQAPLVVWAGWLIPFNAPLILVAENTDQRLDAERQLIRIGYDNLRGYLDGGIESWVAAGYEVESVPTLSVAELRERRNSGEKLIALDVRQDSEWRAGHIPGATHIENGRLPYDQLTLPHDQPIAIYCASGSRSLAGYSVLRRLGYHNLINVKGGFDAWEQAGFEVEH